MSDEIDREAHVAQYRKVADRLAILAGQLRHMKDGPPLDPLDVAGLMANTAANILCHEYDGAHAVAFFRSLASTIEATAGAEKPN